MLDLRGLATILGTRTTEIDRLIATVEGARRKPLATPTRRHAGKARRHGSVPRAKPSRRSGPSTALIGCPTSVGQVGLEPATQGL